VRVRHRHRGEEGVTLIELLLALAILAVLTGFLTGGLSIARGALDSDLSSGIISRTDGAVESVSSLIASAIPVPINAASQKAEIIFDGRQTALSFVGLSEGRSMRGGLCNIHLRMSGSDLVVEVIGPLRSTTENAARLVPIRVVALSGVRDIRFRYFGSTNPSGPSEWQESWLAGDSLPDLVAIQVDFEDPRRNGPPRIVALRQG